MANKTRQSGPLPLDPEQFYRSCDPSLFPFADTTELECEDFLFAQPRAIAALDFGVRINGPGYNLFVLGRPGSGRHFLVSEFLKSTKHNKPAPCDWCYLNNFDEELRPIAISLPAGQGRVFRDDLARLLEELLETLTPNQGRVQPFNRESAEAVLGPLIDAFSARYLEFAQLREYLSKLRENILENADDFLSAACDLEPHRPARKEKLARYRVNLFVDRSKDQSLPVIYEHDPSLGKLMGRIEYRLHYGLLETDFSRLRAGALHRANGGYLILDADRLLSDPAAWNALKRTLYAGKIGIGSTREWEGSAPAASVEAAEIPLDLKVILVGERSLYYTLCEEDPEFDGLFKVIVDFDNQVGRTPENSLLYGRMIGNFARREGLLPLTSEAVARIIEHSARLLGDADKLTTCVREVYDLVREASFWASEGAAPKVLRQHVQQAIDFQLYRRDRLRAEVQDEIQRNHILIDTDGSKTGQVNGLSIIELGHYLYGEPSRITASVRVGEGSIVDIEREADLGGSIHSKGVLILTSYLKARYAVSIPLSISASLVFEQSYGEVEGDSASVAEICALLSAIAQLPIRQWLGVTGSVDQHGRVQVIGGVNEKIEGFFDICKARGLAGTKGVLIPKDNVQHLMLREDVIEAARADLFNIYPIETVDDALTLLSGVPAGQRDAEGCFPEGSINFLVELNLRKMARQNRDFDHQGDPKATKKRKKKDQKPRDSEPSQ